MKIRIMDGGEGGSPVCNAGDDETILLACARSGVILSAPCGGRNKCGKCVVELLEGKVSGDVPDASGCVRACRAVPVSDITIAVSPGVLSGSEIEVLSPAPRNRPSRAGVALDIGTTTVSAQLVDLDTAAILDTVSELNDQRVYGADVMSRIGAARNGKTGELHRLINRETERILDGLRRRWNIGTIEKLSVSGNTTMLHLFLNVDPSGMGELPFTPVFLGEKKLKGEELSLSAENIIVLPSVAAFIGGDVTSGLAALDIAEGGGPSLLVDIGTNGEMALYDRGTIFCCATAAGPAFEGAEISSGMGGIKGAISGVARSSSGGNELSLSVIGNVPPRGICGAGLIDAVALMLKEGIIDETGFMAGAEEGFTLAPGISVTGKDIRQFQLAKSAVLSGIKILCERAGRRPHEIKNVFIAGGFGFFINKRNAVKAGLLPEEFLDVIKAAGNLSLRGASQCLVSGDFIERCKGIISKCTVIDLASDPSFMDEFSENMLFGEI